MSVGTFLRLYMYVSILFVSVNMYVHTVICGGIFIQRGALVIGDIVPADEGDEAFMEYLFFLQR
jgi:hypothetical protein